MNSSSSGATTSAWPHLQSDILTTIADLLCPYLGHIRLRSICHQWRTSLPPSAASPPLSRLPVTTYLFSDSTTSSSFLLTLRHITFSLLTPTPTPTPKFPLNLLHYGFTRISTSSPSPFKKFALATHFVAKGDTVVLGLTQVGALFLCNSAAGSGWVEIGIKGRTYDDIVFHNRRFYATAYGKWRLVVIDCTLRVVDVVPWLNYGCGVWTRLVACHDGLYLVDRAEQSGLGLGLWSGFEVFKLDEKGRFWDYEVDLGDEVFFLREEGSFWLSRRDYDGVVKNVIFVDADNVWDLKRGVLIKLVDSEECHKLCWPPRNWFDRAELL